MAQKKRSKAASGAPNSPTKLRRAAEETQSAKNAQSSRENRNFVQVYPQGWRQMQLLLVRAPQTVRLYMLLAANIDTSGTVIATQDVLAESLNVSKKTIQRHSVILEDAKALVRIPLQGGLYAYAMNPEEVWKAYDKQKEWAAFNLRSLTSGSGSKTGVVHKKLKIMIRQKVSLEG